MNQVTKETNVEIHGYAQSRGAYSMWVKPSEWSQYVEKMQVERDVIVPVVKTLDEFAKGCPMIAEWGVSCNNGHPTFYTLATLIRGGLKPPAKSGPNQGQPRDADKDYSYYWEVGAFLEKPSPKPVSVNGKETVNVAISETTKAVLNKECASNDRTGLMQAVQFGQTSDQNLLTDQEVLRIALEWADALNARTLARLTNAEAPPPPVKVPDSPMVDYAKELGAKVIGAEPLPEPLLESKPGELPKQFDKLSDLMTFGEMNNWNVDNITALLGGKTGTAWVKDNNPDGLTKLVQKFWDDDRFPFGDELPW